MKKLLFIFAAVLFFAGTTVINAQDNSDINEASHTISININTHAMVDVEATNGEATTINLAPTAPTEAGLGLNFDNITDNSLWLNYSSIVAEDNDERSISASVDENLPSGVTIKLAVATSATGGKGNKGTGISNAQTLTEDGVTVVTNIGSCYTGNGHSKGHNLIYSLEMDESNYGNLLANNHSATITYTITGD